MVSQHKLGATNSLRASVNVRSPVDGGPVEFPVRAQTGPSQGDAILCIVVSPDGRRAVTGPCVYELLCCLQWLLLLFSLFSSLSFLP